MALFSKRAFGPWDTAETMIPRRAEYSSKGTVPVTNDTAMRHSGVWACLRLRANLISSMPVDVYRKVNGIPVEVTKPTVLINPGGERVSMQEWLYATQMDLDRGGNCFGLITERYGNTADGLPARIDLQPLAECAVIMRNGRLIYKFGSKEYSPDQVWHERQYTIAGLPFGLSPIAYGAWSIGEYLSVQDYATNWFTSGGAPKAHLRNNARTLNTDQADEIKARYSESVVNGDVWVTGNDWEFKPITMETQGNVWLDQKNYGLTDIARFLDVPADLIDASSKGSSVTYANISERNLQFLIYHLGPAVARREQALSNLLYKPRYVKLNTSALLRMDDLTKAKVIAQQVDARLLAPSEGRALYEREPFTPAQIEEIFKFWPVGMAGQTAKKPKGSSVSDTEDSEEM